ncbi:MAG: DUF1566 domain-containing protein [Spirochaetes bacterium]|nr:DUF1566 domain-containing protein [Spirochaetota bacterium]
MKKNAHTLMRILCIGLCLSMVSARCEDKKSDNGSLLPLLLSDGSSTGEGIIELPKTGQDAGNSIITGDDGNLQIGAAWPDPRFTDNGDGTMTDNLTGLMWEQSPSTSTMDWAGAFSHISGLDTGEHHDWRLPNRNELASLIHRGIYNNSAAWFPDQGFTGIQFAYYWTSNTKPSDTTRALALYLGYCGGYIFSDAKTNDTRYVIACRGTSENIPRTGQTESYATGDDGDLESGVAWPDPRFTDNDDGTMTDNLMGLMWEQIPGTDDLTFSEAIAAADTKEVGGHHDWRVPNINELSTLLNTGVPSIATWLNTSYGFSVQESAYWSSTIAGLSNDYALCIWSLDSDTVSVSGDITVSLKLIAVRDAE